MTTLQEIGRRAVATKVRSERAAAEYKDARELAEAALAKAHTKEGIEKIAVRVPGVGKVATVTVKDGAVEVNVDDDALLATVEEHQPDEVEDVADAQALTDPEVVAWLREHRPDLVTRRVRPVWRTALVKEAEKNGGRIVVEATGEEVEVAKVVHHDPTGAFQINFVPDGRYLVEQAEAAS
ncbi:hypothetical protein GCM10010402_66430 [Actinomadura luteofluorescens]|uniref:hypothetical protein n=1 Tax=Actinomadura luteofluorescens TaxID=46163 RepID=UPI00216441F6|nr:hypothetical protein [Actinomadura glauciflava]MCR3744185.1 hypothetical protein [Actinomadura glauciflava]